jgi:hypothetical protein
MKWTDTQLSYLAGIIDGEGCFCIQRPGGKSHTLRLFVMNTIKRMEVFNILEKKRTVHGKFDMNGLLIEKILMNFSHFCALISLIKKNTWRLLLNLGKHFLKFAITIVSLMSLWLLERIVIVVSKSLIKKVHKKVRPCYPFA